MNLVFFQVKGHKLYKNHVLKIDFRNIGRMTFTDDIYNDFSKHANNLYLPNVVGVFGNNATGKTTLLESISKFNNMIFNQQNLNNFKQYLDLVCDKEIEIKFVFSNNNKLSKYISKIKYIENGYQFFEEYIEKMEITSGSTRQAINNFIENDTLENNERNIKGKNSNIHLPVNLSIFSLFEEKYERIVDTLNYTNFNVAFTFPGKEIDLSILTLVDDSIESFKIEIENESPVCKVKFKNGIFFEKDIMSVHQILSSGTIKFIQLIGSIELVLKEGGILLIDEIELHLNRVLVDFIINLFRDTRINKNNATLIFSSHYVENLDIFDRQDNILITSRDAGFVIDNFKNLVKRTGYKKSELYKYSLDNTKIKYENLLKVKSYFEKSTN